MGAERIVWHRIASEYFWGTNEGPSGVKVSSAPGTIQVGRRVQGKCLVILVTLALHAFCYGDARDLRLNARAVFEGLGAASLGGVIPWVIEVGNSGENTRGVVLVRSGIQTTRHPIELPRGSVKSFITYLPEFSSWSECSLELRTSVGKIAFNLPLPEDPPQDYIGLIGGSSGDMTFLRSEQAESYSTRIRDVYGKPGGLPDRPIGYSACGTLILGEGAERLTDTEVDAIKGWVVSGGTLVFLGGASTPILADPRWQTFLPVTAFRKENVRSLPNIERLAGSPAPAGTFTIAHGRPVSGASVKFSSAGRDLITEKRIGLGYSVYLAVDPFQPPLKQWRGLRKLFINGFSIDRTLDTRLWIFRAYGQEQRDAYYPLADAVASPFNIKLPSPGIVLLILFAHLIISVPLNFFVMRKLGRGELAWLTTPIVCIAFAAIFFSLASGLYQSGQTTRSTGVLVASSLHPTAVFKGRSEIFIPRGGIYDLKLNNVETMSMYSDEYYNSENPDIFHVVDDGTVNVPDLQVSNLAFQEFLYSQLVFDAPPLVLSGKRQSPDSLEVEINNPSSFSIDAAAVHCEGRMYAVGPVAAGGSFKSVLKGKKSTGLWKSDKAMVLTGLLSGYRPGPQIGEDIGSKIEIIFVGPAPR